MEYRLLRLQIYIGVYKINTFLLKKLTISIVKNRYTVSCNRGIVVG